MLPKILAFTLGVLLVQQQAALTGSGFWLGGIGLALIALAFALQGYCAKFWRQGLWLLACLLIGFNWAEWRAEQRLADQLAPAYEDQELLLTGIIATPPQAFGDGVSSGGLRFEFTVEAARLSPTAAPLPQGIPHHVLLSWYLPQQKGKASAALLPPPELWAGERWTLPVKLKRPHGNADPGVFDYEGWLFERNLRATGAVRATPYQPGWREQALVNTPLLWIEHLRQTLRSRFQQALPEADYPYLGVLIALVIGDQHGIQPQQWEVFSRTGITHLLSVSGSHVTGLAALLALLTGKVWRRFPRLLLRTPVQRVEVIAGWLVAFFYSLLAGFAVPAQRTLYMLTVAVLASLSGRQMAARHTLALALLVVLLFDPWAVLSAGFWLSFGAVAALLYASAGQTPGEKDEGMPLWQRLRHKFTDWGRNQWATLLASLPILLLLFQQLSLVSPLANALAIPVVGGGVTLLALLAGALSLLPLPEIVLSLALQAAHALFTGVMLLITPLASWPVWTVPAAPWPFALLAGLGAVLLLAPRGLALRWVGVFFILPVLFWPRPRPPAGEFWLDLLDVGQGLAAVIRTHQHTLLYDTGPLYSAESDAGQRILVPWLRAQGIDRIDTLIVSHGDSDHSGGVRSVLAALPVGQVLTSMPALPAVAGITPPPTQPCQSGQGWAIDGIRFSLLYPPAVAYAQGRKDNHLSCVLHVALDVQGAQTSGPPAPLQSLLLTGDIEAEDETALLEQPGLSADVLIAPHHGSQTSSTARFIAAVRPQAVLIPVGYRNRYGHPHPSVLDRYAQFRLPTWRTDRDGALRLHFARQLPDALTAWRQAGRRYWWAQ